MPVCARATFSLPPWISTPSHHQCPATSLTLRLWSGRVRVPKTPLDWASADLEVARTAMAVSRTRDQHASCPHPFPLPLHHWRLLSVTIDVQYQALWYRRARHPSASSKLLISRLLNNGHTRCITAVCAANLRGIHLRPCQTNLHIRVLLSVVLRDRITAVLLVAKGRNPQRAESARSLRHRRSNRLWLSGVCMATMLVVHPLFVCLVCVLDTVV